MQTAGRDPAPVKQNEKPVLEGSAPRSATQVSAIRRRNRRIEHHYLASAPQSPRKFHVFHQWNRGESAERGEDFAPNENRLIAKKRAAVAAEKPAHIFQKHQSRMTAVEGAEKRTADYFRTAERASDGNKMRVAQNRIGMMKDEDVAARHLGREGHLRAAVR